MYQRVLMKGNEALAEAAIKAGCKYYFGYPITPQNEICEYMARILPTTGGSFVQAESETAAINMVYGAAAAGGRVMTSSSSPGISLMQEGISYLCGAELPCVIVNMMRSGPGLGGVLPAQSDYFQATKGGGHGDYRLAVYGPASVEEMVELTAEAFDVAETYRNPVMILGDAMLGQMLEPVALDKFKTLSQREKPWATTGAKGRRPNLINSMILDPELMNAHNWHLYEKYNRMAQNIVKWEETHTDDAEIVYVAYGTMARICKSAVIRGRRKGVRLGLFRPITLWPFPREALNDIASKVRKMISVEMSTGQMCEDVELAVAGKCEVSFYGKTGGLVPSVQQVLESAIGRSSDEADFFETTVHA